MTIVSGVAPATRVRRALIALALLLPLLAEAAVPVVALRQVATGLVSPVELVNAKDGSNRLFVVEQSGRIRIVQNGSLLTTSFLDIASGVISTGGERGLLGLAFHPNYAANGALYVFYTRIGDGALVVARILRSAANANLADASTRTEILVILHPLTNHNGGRLAFGPDRYLYIATGDGGGGGDPEGNGQKLTTRLGKLLRIAVDGGAGYTIPAGNPFAGQTCATACPEIWAYGLRNPWKFSFDRVTGDLFIGDVGQGVVEEVNFQFANAPGGANYGWVMYEGSNCFAPPCNPAGKTMPVLEYLHNASGGVSITGGYRYRGTRSAPLEGLYIYGDFSSKRLWAARPTGPGTFAAEVLLPPPTAVASISSFGEDEAGEMYLVDYGNGRILARRRGRARPRAAPRCRAHRRRHGGATHRGRRAPRRVAVFRRRLLNRGHRGARYRRQRDRDTGSRNFRRHGFVLVLARLDRSALPNRDRRPQRQRRPDRRAGRLPGRRRGQQRPGQRRRHRRDQGTAGIHRQRQPRALRLEPRRCDRRARSCGCKVAQRECAAVIFVWRDFPETVEP
jgi:glucose/arabinose dehydrogenase